MFLCLCSEKLLDLAHMNEKCFGRVVRTPRGSKIIFLINRSWKNLITYAKTWAYFPIHEDINLGGFLIF